MPPQPPKQAFNSNSEMPLGNANLAEGSLQNRSHFELLKNPIEAKIHNTNLIANQAMNS